MTAASTSTATLYFTNNNPNRLATIGKVNAKTGEVKWLKVDSVNGLAANAHGLMRDGNGNFWFDVNPGRRSLGKLETKTEKISVYQTPSNMSPLGGAVTMDVDGKGKIWASAPDGAVRFDPVTEQFTDFKSLKPYKSPKGSGMTYGAAGDRDGNGWWAQMALDTVGHGDGSSGKVDAKCDLPAVKEQMDRVAPKAREFYENYNELSFNTPLPWSQGPRRMGTDKNADVLWVGNSWGSTLARIDTKTMQTTIIPFPDPAYQPYHIAVDQHHNVWGNLWTADRIVKYDPSNGQWTDVRPADARDGNPPHLAPRAGRRHQGDRADLSRQQDGRDDAAQRRRNRRSQGAGVEINAPVRRHRPSPGNGARFFILLGEGRLRPRARPQAAAPKNERSAIRDLATDKARCADRARAKAGRARSFEEALARITDTAKRSAGPGSRIRRRGVLHPDDGDREERSPHPGHRMPQERVTQAAKRQSTTGARPDFLVAVDDGVGAHVGERLDRQRRIEAAHRWKSRAADRRTGWGCPRSGRIC